MPEAETEIRAAFLWYVERSPFAANRFRAEVFDAIDGLERTADMWAKDEHGVRRYFLSRFPYTVFYELEGDRVVVFAVGHRRRMPRYWEVR